MLSKILLGKIFIEFFGSKVLHQNTGLNAVLHIHAHLRLIAWLDTSLA